MIDFPCKINSFFPFFKRKMEKCINFPVSLIHHLLFSTRFQASSRRGL